jgi:hypothetical protein
VIAPPCGRAGASRGGMGMRAWTAAAAVGLLVACSSVKLVQRDGCWIRQSKKPFLSREELGPCAQPPVEELSEDKLTRLVQECVAREDYRWQERAHAQWSRGEPWAKEDEKNVLERCLSEAARSMLAENDALKQRVESMGEKVAEAAKDRDETRARAEEERRQLVARSEEERKALVARHDEERKELAARTQEERKELISWTADERKQLLATQDKLADHLGEAAKKPLPPATATATATSEGRARSDTETTGTTDSTPVAPVVMAAPSVASPPTIVTMPGPAQVTCTAPVAKEASGMKPAARTGRLPRKATSRPLPKCDPAQAIAGVPAATPPDDEAKALAAQLSKGAPSRAADGGALTPAAPPPADLLQAFDQGTGSGAGQAGP